MRSTKLWYGIGLCATLGTAAAVIDEVSPELNFPSPISAAFGAGEAGEGGESGESENINDYPGSLDDAMEKIWAGEGGEGGSGMGTMWPSVRIPAMTSEQIESTIPGNTLRNDYRIAVYYEPSGTLEGWVSSYEELPADQVRETCTPERVAVREYFLEEARCWKVINNPLSGDWKIREHKLCTNMSSRGSTESTCWHIALVLDRIGMFDEAGKMNKIGKVIMPGRVLGLSGDR